MHALTAILSKGHEYLLTEANIEQLNEISQLHKKLILLLETPPVNLNYEFYYNAQEIRNIITYYHASQRKWENILLENIELKLKAKASIDVWDGFDQVRQEFYTQFQDATMNIDSLQIGIQAIEAEWNTFLQNILQYTDSSISFPPIPSKKPTKKRKGAASQSVEIPNTTFHQLSAMGLNKRQVKEIILQSTHNMCIEHLIPSTASNLVERSRKLNELFNASKTEISSYKIAKRQLESIQQKMNHSIETQVEVKKRLIAFVQHWILMNMNMKGDQLADTEKLTLENFSSINEERCDTEQIVEDGENQENEISSSIPITMTDATEEAKAFLEKLTQPILHHLIQKAIQEWEAECHERKVQLEAVEAPNDIIETPEDWVVDQEKLQKLSDEIVAILSISPQLLDPTSLLNAIKMQTSEYIDIISMHHSDFHHKVGVQRNICEFQYAKLLSNVDTLIN